MAAKFRIEKLRSTDYESWDTFVDLSPQGCIYCKSWWLNAVSHNNYDIYGVYRQNDLIGGMPIVYKNEKQDKIGMPPLTQTLGVLTAPLTGKYVNQIKMSKSITEMLVKTLLRSSYFSCNFHAGFTNWLPFMWEGFKQTTRYTYIIEETQNAETIWSGFAKNIKSDINKAKKHHLACDNKSNDTQRFWETFVKTFYRQSMQPPITYDHFKKIDHTLKEMRCREMIVISDDKGQDHAVIYLVWDLTKVYYLMGGADPELRSSGATSFGLWNAIQFAVDKNKKFDFEGSVVKNIEKHFRAFGGTQTPYFQIRRILTTKQKIVNRIKAIIQ